MKERLQKILSARGVASRRKAEELISQGRVAVNGAAAQLGDTADPEVDAITVDGHPLPQAAAHKYILLNKPRGYVTTLSDEKGRPIAAQLVADCGRRVYPVGRLDMDSEGLLLFTDDGDFANRLMHPRKEVEKVYQVWVTGYTEAGLEQLRQPVELDGYRIRPPKVTVRSSSGSKASLEVTIHEGRNRQVRRMCQIAGMSVTRLRRVQEGSLRLGNLRVGSWRELTPQELAELMVHSSRQ